MTTVAAIIPTIPPRVSNGDLARALLSVSAQTRPVDACLVSIDRDHTGAAATRNRAIRSTNCDWLAFLDDDDHWMPQHVEHLLTHAEATGSDIVYPWFEVEGGTDPLHSEGLPFDPVSIQNTNYIPVTVLVRRQAVMDVGCFPLPGSDAWPHPDCEDWALWRALLAGGAKFSHLNERTWFWRHHGANTAGQGKNWQ